MMSRTLSTPVLEAASISITSMSSPRAMAVQELHLPHGCVVGSLAFSQFSALAMMRAIDVLPTPRVPQKRYAWAMRPVSIARLSVCAMWLCPTTSSNVVERYRRARTVYDIGRHYSAAESMTIPESVCSDMDGLAANEVSAFDTGALTSFAAEPQAGRMTVHQLP